MVNHEHKVYFTRVTKTASSSIEEAFNRNGVRLHRLNTSALDWRHIPTKIALTEHPDLKNYFKFAFVRNPWDRAVSAWAYSKKMNYYNDIFTRDINNFSRFLEAIQIVPIWKQKYCMSQTMFTSGCDYVGKYETIQNDIKTISRRLNIPLKLKSMNISNHGHYSQYYNTQDKVTVEKLFIEDINNYNYKFDAK